MASLKNDEFAARVLDIATPNAEFMPHAYYDPDGDCIEFLAKPDNFRAERVDDRVTVYYSEDTGAIVGSLLRSVCSLVRRRRRVG